MLGINCAMLNLCHLHPLFHCAKFIVFYLRYTVFEVSLRSELKFEGLLVWIIPFENVSLVISFWYSIKNFSIGSFDFILSVSISNSWSVLLTSLLFLY